MEPLLLVDRRAAERGDIEHVSVTTYEVFSAHVVADDDPMTDQPAPAVDTEVVEAVPEVVPNATGG